MEIQYNKVNENGTVTVNATLEQDEINFLVEYAINNLLAAGSAPYLHEESYSASVVDKEKLN